MKTTLSVVTLLVVLVFAVVGGRSSPAQEKQDKYTLQIPGGLAFSEIKGYEQWQVVGPSLTEAANVIRVIVANPVMIKAYQEGVPPSGKPFPDGSKIAKLQWNPKKSTVAPFVVDVPDTFTQAFFIEKDSKRFPNSGGWGYALFNYDAAADTFTADASPDNCGHACHTVVKAKDYIFHPYQKR